MKSEKDWYSHNLRLILLLTNRVAFDLDSALTDLCREEDASGAKTLPALIAALRSLPRTPKGMKAHSDISCLLQIVGLLLVREAERCNVPLPSPAENIADWLLNSFLPAYKASFPNEP